MDNKERLIHFYGLLHLDSEQSSTSNSHVKNFQDQISVYLDCAINLSESLKARNISFTLLTNKQSTLAEMLQSKTGKLQIKQIPFSTDVPGKIRFYSAHFKLDLFRYLSSLNEEYVVFCDLDMICLNDLPSSFINNVKQKIPMYYDISDQVIPAYGHEVIMQSLRTIHGLESEGRWSGGEFISGSPNFFRVLMKEIDNLFSNYVNNIDKMHHVGDEAITSAALEIIRSRGVYIADAGTLGIVGRYWSDTNKCLHPQKPFEYFQRCFILHLPADKRFLADLSKKEKKYLSTFEQQFEDYRKSTQINSKFKKIAKKVLKILPIFKI